MPHSRLEQTEVRRRIDEIEIGMMSGSTCHISYTPGVWGADYIGLDGEFTVSQLEAIVQLMKDVQA
jgi:hypothetical protein